MKQIVIRCDAGFAIGSGHVMRCLTLASELREHGASVSFICRRHDGHLADLITARGFLLACLPAPVRAGHALALDVAACAPAHAAWLGASWHEDAQQSLTALQDRARPDWLIVDHYGIDARWETVLRPAVGRIMVIDDLADRTHDCDLLLDQNLLADAEHRYDNRISAHCVRLLGPRYALLQPEYARLHAQLRAGGARTGNSASASGTVPVRRILVFFGGADNANLTGCAIEAILRMPRDGLMVDVVVAANGRHTGTVRAQVAGHDFFRLHSGLPSLAPLMAQADLAIGGGGATSWERLCLGLPALVATLAENQVPVARELAAKNLIHWMGHAEDITAERIAQLLRPYMEQGVPPIWNDGQAGLVDGKGCARVAAAILEHAPPYCPGDAS